MRRAAVVAVLVSALVGAVGAESIIKARSNSALPKATITVEEVVDSVTVEVSAMNTASTTATQADSRSMSELTYAAN
jgi:hypothetical protein